MVSDDNRTDSDFGTDVPEGYTKVSNARLWFVKEEGAILQGIILNRIKRKDPTKESGEAFYYELLCQRDCKASTADEEDNKKKVEVIARVGQIICIDEFASNGMWQHSLPIDGTGTSVWMKFIRKDKLDGLKTMWKTQQAHKQVKMKNVREEIGGGDIPF